MLLKIFFSIALFFVFNLSLFSFSLKDKEDSTAIPRKSLRIYKTTRLTSEKPIIDGSLNDLCWTTTGDWAGDFTQWIPKEGAAPSFPTELKILYDDNSIYVAIRAFDNPEKIIRKAGRRDEFAGDAVGINFDSYHDHRTGFEFNVTAAGQKVDLLLTNPMNLDYNWNAVWYVEVGMEASAWSAEFDITLT
ncbi:MAG TPA: carbohydrate binding family 9 domain-containing protein [Ignavibacteriaceae bacterium]|nr:carbohydrate binding family 9 domain-containing protein [Ignavibacteriaceae bacterium]